MNNHTPSLPAAKIERRPLLSRWLVAILLGFVSLFLLFFLGESFGEPAMYIGVGAFTLGAQLFLSRGHVAALRKDWPLILCLNFMVLLSAALCFTLEHNNPGAHLTALVLAGVAVACSYAGAGLAARLARNRTPSALMLNDSTKQNIHDNIAEPGPALRSSEADLEAGRMVLRVVLALILGVPSFFLMFVLGEGVHIPSAIPGAAYVEGAIFFGIIAAYFFVLQYLLSWHKAQPALKHWPIILALNLTPLFVVLITAVGERRLGPVLFISGLLALTLACSFAGAALAARRARKCPLKAPATSAA